MPLWRLYYHVVFATDERRPVLTPQLREIATRLLAQQCAELGCLLHAIHVQPDHVHLVTSIPPRQAVATAVGRLKGSTSHALHLSFPNQPDIAWQSGYGVFSFGERHLSDVVRYVRDQDRRHAAGNLWPDLERSLPRGENDGPPRPDMGQGSA